MTRDERVQAIQSMLANRRGVLSFASLLQELEVSPATLKRDLRYLRDRRNAPIEWDRDAGGYRWCGPANQAGPFYTSTELLALLTLQHLIAQIDPAGLIAEHIDPLTTRLQRMLPEPGAAAELRRRVRVIGLTRRPVAPGIFRHVGLALVQRRRLRIAYRARSKGELTEREVSPLRLIHYRENWHLDAWCHLREELRNFSVDAIKSAAILEQSAIEVSEVRLDAQFAPAYGIFSGNAVRWARLRFSPERARWVAQEQWHPHQKGRWDNEGHWLLDLPYADERELVMDILRFVPDVEVLGPQSLRSAVRERLERALKLWGEAG